MIRPAQEQFPYVYKIIWEQKTHPPRKVSVRRMKASDYRHLEQSRQHDRGFVRYYPMHLYSNEEQAYIRDYMWHEEQIKERLLCLA